MVPDGGDEQTSSTRDLLFSVPHAAPEKVAEREEAPAWSIVENVVYFGKVIRGD
jgi:hypothetical protein